MPRRLLDADRVREIRDRYAAGEVQMDIAGAVGVSRYAVRKVCLRETWAWVDPEDVRDLPLLHIRARSFQAGSARWRDRPGACRVCGETFVRRAGLQLQTCSACRDQQRRDRNIRLRSRDRHADVARSRHRREVYADGDLTGAETLAVLRSRTYCPGCRKRMTDDVGPHQRQLDHVVPIGPRSGGRHTLANVQVLCRTCNIARPDDGSDVVQESLFARSM